MTRFLGHYLCRSMNGTRISKHCFCRTIGKRKKLFENQQQLGSFLNRSEDFASVNNLGLTYQSLGKYDKALALFNEAIGLMVKN